MVIGFNNNACLFELKLYWFLVTNAFLYVFVPSCLCVLVTGEFSVHKNDINQVVPYPSQLPSTKRQNLLSFGIKNVKSSHCAEFFSSRGMQFRSLSDSYEGRIFPGDVSSFCRFFSFNWCGCCCHVDAEISANLTSEICLICAAEWDQSSGRVLPLRDDDSQSLIDGEWRKINTLRHYQVKMAFSL